MPAKKDIPRLQPTSPDDLRNTAKRLRTVAARLVGLAASMEEKDQKSADIEGHKSVELAFASFAKFVANCEKKIREF